MGVGTGAAVMSAEGDEFKCGPMAVIVDQIVEHQHKY